ncbi:YadA-like C-terminal region [Stutzerimonas stutzeri]|nr:YadA-like C-terminal region [Stutzerimonas stutzeri]
MSQASQALNATNAGWELTTNATGTGIASGSSVVNVNATNKLVTFTAGDNIEITQSGRNVTMALARDISVNSVRTNDLTVSGTTNLSGTTNISGTMNVQANTTVNMGGNRIQNVGNATAPTDAVNKAYVDSAISNVTGGGVNMSHVNSLNNRITRVERKLRASTAGTAAMLNIPQAIGAGKQTIGAGIGSNDGQNAVAVGYSRVADNNKVIFKVTGAVNTQGGYTAGAGVSYQW